MQTILSKFFVPFNKSTLSLLRPRLYHKQKNLYDVLSVKRDCSEQDIKNAFLKLSKENHPDVKGTGGTKAENEKFIDILHAYRILSKKDSRTQYDIDLDTYERQPKTKSAPVGEDSQRPHYMRYGDLAPERDPNPSPYYGVKGLAKVSNMNIAILLVGIAVLGSIIQFFLIRHSSTLRRDALDEWSKDAGTKHANARADAEKYGNEKQLERLAKKWLQNNSR